MKTKLTSIFALAIMMVSCSNREIIDSDFQQPAPKQTNSIRSYEEALQIAQASIQMVDGQAQTRAASPRKISLNDSKVCLTDSKTRSENGNDTLMYVFNFEDQMGFSVVSANRKTEPLIAVTESGYYDPKQETDIEGFDYFMEMAKEYVIRSFGDPDIRYYCYDVYVYDQPTYTVGPYVNVMWGQRYPEGEHCPNGISGCSITAMAQIMSYFEFPTSINLTYMGTDSLQNLNWTSMKAHSTGHTNANCTWSNLDAHNSIGRLCRQLGKLANSRYKESSTSTRTDSTRYALISLGFHPNEFSNYSGTYIKSELNNNHPLLIRGTHIHETNTAGHMWVLDGYNDISYTIYTYKVPEGFIGQGELEDISGPFTTNLYHFNWGWYGKNNGYFASAVLSPLDVILPDTNTSITADYNFQYNVLLLSVYPDN